MIKDQPDDLDLGDETLEARQFERSQLGNAVVQLRMYYLDKLKTTKACATWDILKLSFVPVSLLDLDHLGRTNGA